MHFPGIIVRPNDDLARPRVAKVDGTVVLGLRMVNHGPAVARQKHVVRRDHRPGAVGTEVLEGAGFTWNDGRGHGPGVVLDLVLPPDPPPAILDRLAIPGTPFVRTAGLVADDDLVGVRELIYEHAGVLFFCLIRVQGELLRRRRSLLVFVGTRG
jgi:hypothetical protein